MSDPTRVGAKPYSKIHLGNTVDSVRSKAPPPRQSHPQPRQQQVQVQVQVQHQEQPQPIQQQPLPQPMQPPEASPQPFSKGQKRSASKQRSQSSSPEKLRPFRHRPTVNLQPKPYVDTSGWDHSAAIGSRPGGLAAPILFHNDGNNGLDVRTDEIEKRLTGFRFVEQVPVLSLGHAYPGIPSQTPPFSGFGPPYIEDPYQNQTTSSPETSPTNASLSPNFTCAATGPVSDDEFEILLPHYASFFRPRIPSLVTIESLTVHSPVPTFHSIDQTVAAEKALTKFHIGVLLADKRSGGDQQTWWRALRKVVRENMIGLSNFGVHPHQIVFYYHGRGDIRVGNDVWNAIKAWQRAQMGLQRANSWSGGSGDSDKQEVFCNSKYEDLERQARQSRQREQGLLKQKEGEGEKTRFTSNEKARTKWNNFAKQEGLKSWMNDGTASGLEKIYEDEDEDDSKTA